MATTEPATGLITLREVRNNAKVRAYVEGANDLLNAIGYTEHGHRHAGIVASIARYVLDETGADPRAVELGAIAGYLHDVGNVVSRTQHWVTGGIIALRILEDMGMGAGEIATVIGAIGNHEEPDGLPFNEIAAAVTIADKSDVHYSRVQNPLPETFDIHDRVNHAVQRSRVHVNPDTKVILLELEIDTAVATVMEYFEIFLNRMVACRQASDRLGYTFKLSCNGVFLE
jgi:metal-dependent HD superfamily phosphatase/phosphodiesterase